MDLIDFAAMVIGYAVMGCGALLMSMYVLYFFIEKILRHFDAYPLFLQTMRQLAIQRNRKREVA
jgi:type IV secretory pathway VirB3-like protein